MIIQTNQFIGVSPERLYTAYLSSEEHGKMTGQGDVIATYHRIGTTKYIFPIRVKQGL